MQRIVGKLGRPFGNLHYEVTGSGPALLFAHGLGGNQMSWWQQVAHFSSSYTSVAFAHRGFAPSDPVPGGPDAEDYSGTYQAFFEGLSELRLDGKSMTKDRDDFVARSTPPLRAYVAHFAAAIPNSETTEFAKSRRSEQVACIVSLCAFESWARFETRGFREE